MHKREKNTTRLRNQRGITRLSPISVKIFILEQGWLTFLEKFESFVHRKFCLRSLKLVDFDGMFMSSISENSDFKQEKEWQTDGKEFYSIFLTRLAIDDIDHCWDKSFVYCSSERRDRFICLIIGIDSCIIHINITQNRCFILWQASLKLNSSLVVSVKMHYVKLIVSLSPEFSLSFFFLVNWIFFSGTFPFLVVFFFMF